MLRRGHLWLLAPLLVACSETTSAPQPELMDPATAPAGQVTTVRILGRGFRPLVRSNFNDKTQATVSDRFTAALGTHPLGAVQLVSGVELSAEVPGTLEPGTYDLTVVDPAGIEGELEQAFTVTAADGGPAKDGGVDGPSLDTRPAPDQKLPDLALPDLMLPDLTLPPDLLKPLGTSCSSDSQCISGHCVDRPSSNTNKVCCFKHCSEKQDEGCSSDGTKCID